MTIEELRKLSDQIFILAKKRVMCNTNTSRFRITHNIL